MIYEETRGVLKTFLEKQGQLSDDEDLDTNLFADSGKMVFYNSNKCIKADLFAVERYVDLI